MNRIVTRIGVWRGPALAVLGVCLFADCPPLKTCYILGTVLAEAVGVLGDPSTQWMVFVCAGVYLLAFVVLRRRLAGAVRASEGGGLRIEDGATGLGENGGWRMEDGGSRLRTAGGLAAQWLEEPAFWLSGLLVLGALAYGINYTEAVKTTNALTFLGAAMIGQGAGLWESRPVLRRSTAEGGKQKAESRNVVGETVLALVILLAAAAVWQAEAGHFFKYRDQPRWSGPWDNPNTFGMLMGAGAVLAVGLLVWSLKSKVQSPASAECGVRSAELGNAERRMKNAEWVKRVVLLVGVAVMGVGLAKSYSRGAWVGAVVALTYLLLNAEGRRKNAEWGKAETGEPKAETARGPRLVHRAVRHWVALALICGSVGVLGFWSFGHTERAVARRAYSAANANDFSWRNRVAAYEGALQMMAERPWFGFGWNQPERAYDQYYRPAKVNEGMAFQLNDYFMLGATLGVPALACFVMYVGLSFSPKSKVQSPKSESHSLESEVQSLGSEAESPKSRNESLVGALQGPMGAGQRLERGAAGAAAAAGPTLDFGLWTLDFATVCRAGAIVLLVGFWFDGGLFKLATGATFWVLLELGRAGGHEAHEAHENGWEAKRHRAAKPQPKAGGIGLEIHEGREDGILRLATQVTRFVDLYKVE